jgi:hypothetical protein
MLTDKKKPNQLYLAQPSGLHWENINIKMKKNNTHRTLFLQTKRGCRRRKSPAL